METIISILLAFLGGLGFMFFRERNKSRHLQADKDLTDRTSDSKMVDKQIKCAKKKIDKLESDKSKPVGDDFWDDYTGE